MLSHNPIKISILIPAHNEEAMIEECIFSCFAQTRQPDQIVVVNDGSTDATAKILARFGDLIDVVTIDTATGNKSRAQEIGLSYVTGDVVIATDGDTVLGKHFVESVALDFECDSELAVVVGYVTSAPHNILTALREIDYTIGQDLYKRAQSIINFILVIPGCAGAFRTDLFRNNIITFEHDTLTEDLDFTYKLNALGLKIKLNYNAVVYTQDPPTINSYINQMRRWYGGGWQNLLKHLGLIFDRPNAMFILTTTYVEGLIFNLAIISILFINTEIFLALLSAYLVMALAFGLYASIRKKRLELLLVCPLIPLMTMLNAYILLEQFILEVILRKKNMFWFQPARRKFTANMSAQFS